MATTHKYREGIASAWDAFQAWLNRPSRASARDLAPRRLGGRSLAVSRLVSELDSAFPAISVVISTTTRTGQALARERFGANRVFYCPLDLPWAVRAYLNALKPRLLILAETEFWPNLLSGCFRRGIPVAVVNARISDRSWPRYRRLRRLWRPFLSRLSRVLAQSETDAERCRHRLRAGARLRRRQSQIRCARRAGSRCHPPVERCLPPDLRLIVAGSTLEGEEAALLEAWPDCSQPIRNWLWSSRRAIRSDSAQSLRCSKIRHSRGSGARPGAADAIDAPRSTRRPARSSFSTPSANWLRSTRWPRSPSSAAASFPPAATIRSSRRSSPSPS